MRRLNCFLALAVVLLTCALAAGQCAPCTIWPVTATPGTVDSGDPSSVELGVKFQAASTGYITGIRFYKSAANVGTHIGNLWNDSGTLLATAQFTQETPTGWQQVSFSTPVLISANTTYVASYFAPLGHYSADNTYFTSSGYSNPPLDALGNGVDGPNGVFNVGSTSAFPASNVNPSNYWVDVVYVSQGETAAPTVVSTTPASGSSGAAATSSISASFSAVMNPATITSSSFQLFGPSNNAIAGTVSYSSSTASVVFQPNASLAYQTTYTAAVQGTVQDFLGNSLGNNFSWTFTTGYGPSNRVCPCTIFPVTSAPSVADSGDGTTIEVGVKFRADVNGFITGIRFYKAATNTGTHIGNLWTVGGSLLESVVFTGETASGWQQATFATPVPITAGTTYVASYFAPVGHYSFDEYYLTNNVDNSPLHALSSSSSGGNGVFIATASSAFPSSSFNATNYGVDVSYLLQTSTTPPVILSVTPGNGATGIPLGGPISVQFNEPMNPTTIIGSAFQLVDASNNVIPGTVTYVPSSATLQFQPSLSLLAQATYTATVYGTVQDAFGNALGTSYSWSFTTAPPPGDSGPGGPILVIASSVNPFSSYLGEILLNEGLNEFRVKDITTVTSTVLSQYDIVILGDFALTSAEASMLNTWVSGGGSLIAMHPDPQLAGMLGLTSTGGTLSDQYMLVNTGAAPGAGIYGQTMQFHGPAELFTLNGATALATLYSSQTAPTISPAVTIANAGSGQAAAFTYDLARSVVYLRQGNPAWAGQQRDPDLDLQVGSLEGGTAEIRASDLFYGNASFDPEPDWVNLNTVQVPQADEQQRLFTNLIQLMNLRRKPLPRFWYLPNGYQAAVVMTGDDHGGNGTQPRFDIYVSQSPANCSVTNWTCVRATSYVFPANVTFNPATSYTNYIAEGFEIANHSDNLPTCTTFTAASLQASIVASQGRFTQYFPLAPASQTNRTHCVLWSDYDSEPTVLLNNGIRFDTSYYYWPDSWVQDRPGLFTGSGLPMRYSDRNGNTINVYQATTQFPDETTWTMPNDIDTVLANATGALGFYAVITANMHTDNPQETESDQIVAAAQSYGVPVVASLQMLQWLDGRNNSTFGNMSWASNTLSFTVTPAANANNLEVMIPATSASGALVAVLVNGVVQPYALQTVKGLQYATFLTTGGAYQAVYGQSYSVSGTISGAGGNGATVTIVAGTASATTTANASGAYTFTGVPNGVTYTVTPSNGSYTFTPASQSVAVNGANVNGVNFATVVTTYSLSGTISGAGGNGATVTLSGAGTGTTTASSTGAYTFSGLANGAYTVMPSMAGYSYSPTSQSASVNGANLTGVNFSSSAATYSISGTISGAGGNGATVTLSGATTATATASSTGTYIFSGLANGAYTVTPSKTGYSFSPTSQAATVNGANLTVNFSSSAVTYTISGTISGAGGNGATVNLSGAATATTTASSTGTYTFSGLANGAYTVTPSKTGYSFSPTSQAATVNGANLTVNFSSSAVTYTISGTISGAGGNGATVSLSGAATATATTSSTGTYTFSGLANGAYTVTPSKTGYSFSPTSQAATVNGANLTVNFSSSAATYTISGTISGPGGNSPTVTLSGAATATTTASSTGTYTFSGLANGAYTVTPSMAGYAYSPASQSATVNGANQTVNFSSTVASTAVNLSSYYNVYGIATSGNAPKSGGLDGSSDSYNSSTLGTTATYQGLTFTFGPANAPDGVTGLTIPLPAGSYSQLYLLGSASYGGRTGQTFVVTYTDGTTSTYTQSISDWWSPQNYTGETNVTAASNIINSNGAVANDPVDLYGYTFNLAAGKTATKVALPSNRNVVFLAIGLGSTTPTAATPQFNPTPGNFSPSVSVTLSDTAPGAVIHYTTNNTAPTAGSAVYSAAIPVTTTTTIQAIAVAPGYNNSAVASGTYNIVTYSISGTISGPGGNGATVTLSGASTATTTASSTGTYTFSGLANGAYTVTPSMAGYSYTPTSQAATVNGANLTGVNFATVTYSISGTISGAGGNGATVTLSGAGTATTTASSTGTYTLSGLANGAYTVTPSKTGYTFTPTSQAATVNGTNLTGVNFSSTAATYSISGTISGAGGNGATVTLSGAGTATTTASSTGTFTFSGLVNGAYTVTPSKSGFAFTPASSSATVSNANVTGVNFATVTYSISGTISGLGGNAATVTLSGAGSATTTASSTGTFTFSGLANGAYTVTPSKSGFTFTPASLGATVSNANVTGVNFATVTYTISGTISGAGGNAATVALSGAATATTTASSTGTYSFSGLVNGAYTVTPTKSGYSFSPASQSATVNGANLTENFSSTASAFSISGTISGAGGNGATVLLNGTSTASTTASSTGTYSFSGLANGNYSVTPVMTGYNYSPTSQVIALNSANVTTNFSSTVLGTAVSLSSYYNVDGIATIGNAPKSGGFDNDSYGFNSSILGTSLTYQNLSFSMGAANAADAVDNKTITLPSGQYGKLFLLGAGVNGNQTNQSVVVTYSDGSTTTFSQSFSDWATPQSYSGETTVSANSSRIGPNGQSSALAVNIYGYTFTLSAAKTVSSVKLPASRNVVFVGVGVGSPTPTPITPYVQVNGAAWQSTTTATVAHGSTVNLGPQPLTGTWSWIGPGGFTSTSREIDKIPLSVGVNVFVTTYTSGNGAQTVQPFVITSN